MEHDHNTSLLLHAAKVSSKKSTSDHTRFALNENIYSSEAKNNTSKGPDPISPDEALSFLLENSLSKQQYNNLRSLNKKHGCDIFPSYDRVLNAKSKCRPKDIQVTETVAQVSLQNM